jgi:hypothetical protein
VSATAAEFGGWVAMALARSPETAIKAITGAFPESRIRAAQQAIARKPDGGPEPVTEPDQPGAEQWCDWCGRTDPEHGLTRVYETPVSAWPSVPDPETPGQHIPVFRKVAPEPPDLGKAYEPPHCVDEPACYRERADRVDQWRSRQYPGWQPSPAELAWLGRERAQAREVLALAQAAGYAIKGWAELQEQLGELEPRQDDVVALSGTEDAVALSGGEPFGWAISAGAESGWEHTLRGNPLHRSHTLGWQLRQFPQYEPVPAAGAVQGVTEAVKTARTRRRKIRRRVRLR